MLSDRLDESAAVAAIIFRLISGMDFALQLAEAGGSSGMLSEGISEGKVKPSVGCVVKVETEVLNVAAVGASDPHIKSGHTG